MAQIILREYQKKGMDMLYADLNQHDRVIWWMMMGLGKTISFIYLAQACYNMGMNVVIVIRRRELIKQTSKELDKFNLEHGVYMAGHQRYLPKRRVQLCSVDTLGAREIYPHEKDQNTIVLVDESHDATPRAGKYSSLFNRYNGRKIVGFTATPFSDNSMFESIICPITPMEALEQGFLVPVRPYVPNIIDVSNVRIKRTGQFSEDELFEACSKSEVIGDIVDSWIKYGQNKRTMLYGVSIEHSKMICEAFLARGIPAIHCDAKTKSDERDRAVNKLRKDEVKILCNVGIWTTGEKFVARVGHDIDNHISAEADSYSGCVKAMMETL